MLGPLKTIMYRIKCTQCDYTEKAKTANEAKYLRNQHMKYRGHFDVDYKRIG
jgi:hypothetical protein